jgi:hypothetical protein
MARELPGYDQVIALSDAEREERLDRLVHKVDVHDEDLAKDFWMLIDELNERHAPRVARMSIEHHSPPECLEQNLEAMRQREGARLIRSALDEGESA